MDVTFQRLVIDFFLKKHVANSPGAHTPEIVSNVVNN